jgi:phytoene dehydrogenase-like protein
LRYDSIIIGAGLSGLAAGIRLAHFGKKVCICEQHSKTGGLNSYYSRKGIEIDSGLHAMTNFAAAKDQKSLPLLKLLRQLRIPHANLKLREQNGSKIAFPGHELNFSNDFSILECEVRREFPEQIDNFIKLDNHIRSYNGLDVTAGYISARKVLNEFIKEPLLIEMLFCPLMYYGSAVENDMDFAQFAIMYRSIFHEGFCRPADGIKSLLTLLEKRFTECGGRIIKNSAKLADSGDPTLCLNCGIRRIITIKNKVSAVELNNGEILETEKILSSAGFAETIKMIEQPEDKSVQTGQLAFVETVAILPQPLSTTGYKTTITFFNKSANFAYQNPETLINGQSGVVCVPDNFKFHSDDTPPHPQIRITMLANHKKWINLEKNPYNQEKMAVENEALKIAAEYSGITTLKNDVLFTDIFTPKTVMRYTGHINGAVYGSPDKQKNGLTSVEGLFLCGTDQGFLGITGSMLSGISMANMHILQG